MPLDPDQDSTTPADPPDPTAPAGEDHPEPPRTPEERLSVVYRQWRTPGRPTGKAATLTRATAGSPGALPYLDLLGVDPLGIEEAWEAWDAAQLASDSTPLGRVLRPIVELVPWGGRWTVARSIGRTSSLEPIDHVSPAQALSAAAARFELVAARRVGEPLDELAAQILADEAAVAVVAAEPAADSPEDATDADEGAE